MNLLYTFAGLLFSIFAFPLAKSDAPPVMIKKIYEIRDESKLFLEGSSNINEFRCDCKQDFPPQTLIIRNEDTRDAVLYFDRSQLKITTTRLDCGHKVMNKDMYQTLKANEYPEITIELKEVRPKGGSQLVSLDNWGHLVAVADITIAGIRQEVLLDVDAKKTGPHEYRFRSAKVLNMSDFGLDPPAPLLGLIKVNDEIRINLDLLVLARDA